MPDSDAAAVRADIVVALTTYNDARTIGPVIRAVTDGLARAFAPTAARIVIADAGSTDTTMTAAREAGGAALAAEHEGDGREGMGPGPAAVEQVHRKGDERRQRAQEHPWLGEGHRRRCLRAR